MPRENLAKPLQLVHPPNQASPPPFKRRRDYSDYTRARQLAAEAECAGVDLVEFLRARAPELLGC